MKPLSTADETRPSPSVQMDPHAQAAHETELLVAAKAGDHQAFEDLLRIYERPIHRCGLRMMRNHEDADDVLQEVAFKMYCHLTQYEGRARFASWVGSIAVNQCRMMIRNRKPEHNVESLDAPFETEEGPIPREVVDGQVNPEQLYSVTEIENALSKIIKSWKSSYQEVFLLCDVEEYSLQEVAQALGTTVAAVKSRLHRARLKLRGSMPT